MQYTVLRRFQVSADDSVSFLFFGFSIFQSVPQVTKCLLVLRVTRKSQNTLMHPKHKTTGFFISVCVSVSTFISVILFFF